MAVALTAVAIAMAFSAPSAGAATSPNISVVQHPTGDDSPCRPAMLAATGAISSDSVSWSVTITAVAPICDPVTAVIYAMPNNIFWPWPQHKLEAKTFTVGTGVTTITFTKGCDPVQFDVVTGATPDAIQPNTGPMHGPLLFLAPYTGVQNWPGPCGGIFTPTTVPPPPVTIATTTTTTAVVADSTTIAPTTTTTAGGNSASATTTSAAAAPGTVLGATETRPTTTAGGSATKPATEQNLAFTGGTVIPLIAIGLVLMVIGAASIAASRRRREEPFLS